MIIETPHVLAPCGLMLREGQYIVTEDGVVCSNGGGGGIVPATADTLGGIKVGGSFNITADGVLSTKLPDPPADLDPTKEYVMKNGEWVESSTAEISPATTTTLGGVKIGSSFEMDANDKIQLKAPTGSTLGGVKAGASGNIVIDSNGNISTKIPEAPTNDGKQYIMKGTVDGNGEWVEFVVPIATDTIAGGVIVGDGLSVGADGTISTTIQEAPTDGKQYVRKGAGWNEFAYDPATATTLGGVSIKANGGIKNESGEISVDKATATTLGGVSVPANSGLDLDTNGALTLAEATDTTLGGVMVDGEGLEVDTDGKVGINVGTGLAIDGTTGELYVDETVNALSVQWDGSSVTGTIVYPTTTTDIQKCFDEFIAGKKPLGFGVRGTTDEKLTGIVTAEENQSGIKVFKSYVEYQGKQYVFIFKRNTTTVTVEQVKDVFSVTISDTGHHEPSCSIPELDNAIAAHKIIVGYYNPTAVGTDPIHRAFVFNSWHEEGGSKYYEFYARDLEKLYKYQLQVTPVSAGADDVVGTFSEISSGGSDTLIANFTGDGITATCDKTVAEVWSAISSGKDVRATYNGNHHCYVEIANNTSAKFVGIINVQWNETAVPPAITHIRYVECEMLDDHGTQANKAREYQVAVGGNTEPLVVTFVSDGGEPEVWSADKTATEIITAYNTGMTVVGTTNGEDIISLTNIYEDTDYKSVNFRLITNTDGETIDIVEFNMIQEGSLQDVYCIDTHIQSNKIFMFDIDSTSPYMPLESAEVIVSQINNGYYPIGRIKIPLSPSTYIEVRLPFVCTEVGDERIKYLFKGFGKYRNTGAYTEYIYSFTTSPSGTSASDYSLVTRDELPNPPEDNKTYGIQKNGSADAVWAEITSGGDDTIIFNIDPDTYEAENAVLVAQAIIAGKTPIGKITESVGATGNSTDTYVYLTQYLNGVEKNQYKFEGASFQTGQKYQYSFRSDPDGTSPVGFALTKEHSITEPLADGTFVRKAKTESGTTTYSWEESAGVFMVKLIDDGDDTYSIDKTFAEISTAYNEGKAVFLDAKDIWGMDYKIPLTRIDDYGTYGEALFAFIESSNVQYEGGVLSPSSQNSLNIKQIRIPQDTTAEIEVFDFTTIEEPEYNEFKPDAQYARKRDEYGYGSWAEISGGMEEPTADGTYLRKKDGTTYSWQSYTPFTEAQIKGWIDEKIIATMSAGY